MRKFSGRSPQPLGTAVFLNARLLRLSIDSRALPSMKLSRISIAGICLFWVRKPFQPTSMARSHGDCFLVLVSLTIFICQSFHYPRNCFVSASLLMRHRTLPLALQKSMYSSIWPSFSATGNLGISRTWNFSSGPIWLFRLKPCKSQSIPRFLRICWCTSKASSSLQSS